MKIFTRKTGLARFSAPKVIPSRRCRTILYLAFSLGPDGYLYGTISRIRNIKRPTTTLQLLECAYKPFNNISPKYFNLLFSFINPFNKTNFIIDPNLIY